MPCPAFHPTREVNERTRTGGRFPLINEYDGVCKVDGTPYTPDRDTLFRCCNHGYSGGACPRIPSEAAHSSLRYSILVRGKDSLQVMCVEETDYEPRKWHTFEYVVETAEVKCDALTDCMRAQAAAFCLAYVRRFPA
jgi:hypothetical protein